MTVAADEIFVQNTAHITAHTHAATATINDVKSLSHIKNSGWCKMPRKNRATKNIPPLYPHIAIGPQFDRFDTSFMTMPAAFPAKKYRIIPHIFHSQNDGIIPFGSSLWIISNGEPDITIETIFINAQIIPNVKERPLKVMPFEIALADIFYLSYTNIHQSI